MSNALNAVYNNYLSAYAPKSLTRYDAHKKSELRNVYNSIVKQSKEAPWYLPTTSKDMQKFAVNIKENARELHHSIAQLGGLEENGLLDKKRAFTTNEDIATVSYIGDSESQGTVSSFSLEVHSLASPQENMGLFLPDDFIGLAPDTYSFDIAVNDMNYEFQFAINEGETNRDVQSRLMRLVNNSNIGLKAALAESDGKTALRITSESSGLPSGKSHIFNISDDRTSKRAGAVDYFGLDYVSREPADARFSIDGEETSTSSNNFTVGKVFEVQLRGISPEGEPTQIGLKTDIDSLTDNVTHLVSGYNEFIKAASSYTESQTRSRQLIQEMKGIANRYSNVMESMGMNLAEDGTLKLDDNLLKQAAIQAEDVSNTFSYLKDFSDSLLMKSNQVSLNPMDYVDKKIVAYKNPGHNFANPYITSAYSGMMFNGYC